MARPGAVWHGNTRPGAVSGTIFQGLVRIGMFGTGAIGRGWARRCVATTLSGVR